MSSTNEPIPWSRHNHDIYEDFVLDYCDFVNGGDIPAKANQDMKYVLGLQRKRLDEFGIETHIEAESTGTGATANQRIGWQDNLYEGRQRIMPCTVRRTFSHGDKKLRTENDSLNMYQTSLSAKDPARAHDRPFTCPNCGNVSTVGQLQDGCPFCGTHFKYTDLFPRISNFYFLDNASPVTGKKMPLELLKFYVPALIIIVVVAIAQGGFELRVDTVISTLIGGLLLCYPLWALSILAKAFYKSGKSIWLVFASAGSRKRFQREMSNLDPNFSFEYFTGKAILLLEMLVFSNKPQELPTYEGAESLEDFEDIVQLDYCGAAALHKFRVEGSACYADVEVYADVLRCNGKSLHKEREIFSLTLYRNVNQPLDIGYSPLKVRCDSCGASFDAVHQKHCPYCGTSYENDHRDWTVASVKARKYNPALTLLGVIILLCLIPIAIITMALFANFIPLVILAVIAYTIFKATSTQKAS